MQLPFFLEKTSPGLNFPQSSVVEAQTIQLTQTELQVVFRGKGGEATCFFLPSGKKQHGAYMIKRIDGFFFATPNIRIFFGLFWTDRMILYYQKRIQMITLKQVTGFPIEFLPTKKWHLVFGQLHNRAPLSVVICLKLTDLSKKVQKEMGRWEVFVHCPVGMVFNFISC